MTTPQRRLTATRVQTFRRLIWNFYTANKRLFPWRDTTDPYAIVVSEIMLQQTQTHRVAKKFPEFLKRFPTMKALAEAPLSDVLRAWQGLGYNRRAIALQTIAKRVINEFGGRLPNNPEMLETFPGIGPNTAGSICAFAFNAPTVFIETNIRAVFLHHFFPEQEKIHDRGLLPLVDITLERERPREWYYALMDYGVHLKKLHRNPSRRSAHYTKQSTFEGSHRQLRARLLRQITERGHLSLADLVDLNKEREEAEIARALSALEREHFIAGANDHFTIS